eukprot:1909760-Rhodomonas_salina.2
MVSSIGHTGLLLPYKSLTTNLPRCPATEPYAEPSHVSRGKPLTGSQTSGFGWEDIVCNSEKAVRLTATSP